MDFETCESPNSLSASAARMLLHAIRDDPSIVLGLPTGRTPIGMYAQIVEHCSREYHCFQQVTTFNLDEYAGISPLHPGSYHRYMREHLIDKVDLDLSHVHIPDGNALDLGAECARYEQAITRAGGLSLTVLGLGTNGHIGFNEPGTAFDSRTRVVELSESTRRANAPLFPVGDVPLRAITIGIATILESKKILLLAAGAQKREAVERLRSHEIHPQFPAGALWLHRDVKVLVA